MLGPFETHVRRGSLTQYAPNIEKVIVEGCEDITKDGFLSQIGLLRHLMELNIRSPFLSLIVSTPRIKALAITLRAPRSNLSVDSDWMAKQSSTTEKEKKKPKNIQRAKQSSEYAANRFVS